MRGALDFISVLFKVCSFPHNIPTGKNLAQVLELFPGASYAIVLTYSIIQLARNITHLENPYIVLELGLSTLRYL